VTSDLEKVREAYARARAAQPSEYPPLPTWENLPLQMREAFIDVFGAGRMDAFREEEAKRRKP
jgi:hypothetical protein